MVDCGSRFCSSLWIFGCRSVSQLAVGMHQLLLIYRFVAALYEWSLGTIEIVRARARGLKEDIVGKLSVEIDGGESVTTNSDVAMEDAPGSSTRQLEWTPEVPMRLPFFSRLAPVNFSIDSVGTLRTSDKWQASLWLTTIGSDDTELEIPLVE